MRTQLKKIALAGVLALAVGTAAFADSSAPAASPSGSPVSHHRHKRMKAAFKACAAANGITLPAKGSGQQLSSADKTTLKACVQEFRQEVKSCIQSSGVSKPEEGQEPSAAQKAAFKQCRSQALSKISASGSN